MKRIILTTKKDSLAEVFYSKNHFKTLNQGVVMEKRVEEQNDSF